MITGSCVGGQTSEDKEFEGSVSARPPPVSSADDSSHHGQCRRQPHLNGDGLHRARLHALDGMLLGSACHGSCLLDGEVGRCADCDHRRQRGAIQLGLLESLGGDASSFSDNVPPVLPRPQRDDTGRRWRHDGAGTAGSSTSHEAHASMRSCAASACPPTPAISLIPRPKGRPSPCCGPSSDASARPVQVGYINAHGTGTEVNDPTEAGAICEVFGPHTDKIAVSSTKSMHGHALGAAAAMEAAATVLGLHHDVLPPTANFTEQDPSIRLDVIANQARPGVVEYAHVEFVRIRRVERDAAVSARVAPSFSPATSGCGLFRRIGRWSYTTRIRRFLRLRLFSTKVRRVRVL